MQQLDEKVVYSVTRQGWLDSLAQSIQQLLNRLFNSGEAGRATKDFLNGVWLAHPLHPMITDVAVGAWTASTVLDGVEIVTGQDLNRANAITTGLGIAGGVASAAAGFADWSDTSAETRRIGLVHALANVTVLGLYTTSLWSRLSGRRSQARLFSGLGFVTLLTSGYLGGDLAYRLGNQVDRNAYAKGSEEFVPVMRDSDLPSEKPTRVEAQGIPVLLVRHGSQIYALNDVCSHQGCGLSEGRLEGDSIVCHCHGSTYNLEDGRVVHGPSPFPQPHYEVRVQNGQIEVRTALR